MAKKTIEYRFQRYIFRAIGQMLIDKIEPRDVLKFIEEIEGRGCVDLSHRILTMCSQVLSWSSKIVTPLYKNLMHATVPQTVLTLHYKNVVSHDYT